MPEILILMHGNWFLMRRINIEFLLKKNISLVEKKWIFTFCHFHYHWIFVTVGDNVIWYFIYNLILEKFYLTQRWRPNRYNHSV